MLEESAAAIQRCCVGEAVFKLNNNGKPQKVR
jgi:hypothetical protein